MKKLLIVIAFVILLAGCGNNNKDAIIKKWSKKVDGMDSYLMKGTLEIYRNEDLYTYDLESAYLKKDKFRVGLTNKTNNHEQIILKNDKGVYVVTPSLNKSFKFQSEWPYNNSQIYLLQPLLIDLKNDDKVTLEEKDSKYILTAKVNYINDKNLNLAILSAGWAVTYRTDDKEYLGAERTAQKQKIGVWQGKFMRPEYYRRLQREKNKENWRK